MQPQANEEVLRRQFQIGVCLGRGGFGEVYRAKMSSSGGLEADVAVKVLRQDVDPAGQALQRLRDEGRMLARLNHPAILRVHDLVLLDGCVCLVAEYVEGEDMGLCISGDEPLPVRAVVEVIGAVASALDAAWKAPGPDGQPMKLVHRDIKPANIRISRHGQIKLLDFGIAKSDGNTAREAKTATNMIVGSPGYMAPERFLEPEVIPASDVFALGCVLFEGITHEQFFGELPIPVQTGLCVHEDRFQKHLAKQLAKLPATLNADARAMVVSLLEYDPAKRPTAGALAARCDEIGDAIEGQTLARWARTRKWRDVELADGPLVGRSLTEGTMTRSALTGTGAHIPGSTGVMPAPGTSGTLEVPRPGNGAKIAVAVAVAAVLIVAIGAATVLALGGGAATLYYVQPTSAAAVTPPVVDPPVVEAPVEAPVVEAPGLEALPVEAPVAEAPPDDPPVVAPATAPPIAQDPTPKAPKTPTAPPPTAAATPPVAPTAARVAIGFDAKGAVTAQLVGSGGSYALPASVDPGEYQIRAVFAGGDPVTVGRVNIVAGQPLTIACNAAMGRCKEL